MQGGAAEQDGRLKPGDRLMSVNETKLEHSTLDYAVQTLKGTPRGITMWLFPDELSNATRKFD